MKKLFFIVAILAIVAIAFIPYLLPICGASLATLAVVGKTNKQLENYSKNFSSFSGKDAPYTGFNDDQLDFGGNAKSFMDKLQANRIFTMVLTSTLAANCYVTLIPDYTWAPRLTGSKADGAGNTSYIAYDGAIKTVDATSLTGSGTPSNIVDFLSYIAKRPTQCGMIRISVDEDHTNQLDQQIIVGSSNPFASPGYVPIPIQNSVLPNYFNQKVALVKTPDLVLGDEIQLSLLILAGATVSISFYCGAVISNFAALKNKMSKASQTITAINNGNIEIPDEV